MRAGARGAGGAGSAGEEPRRVRLEERLKIKIGEAKNLPARSHGTPSHRDTYCVLSLDQEEIFRTSTIERTLNPFFGEEFQFEVPRRFRYLSIYAFDRDKHLKQDKVLGKVAIKREDLHLYNNKDHWFALRPVDADSEVQGKAHIEVSVEDSRRRLRVEPKPPPQPPSEYSDLSSTSSKSKVLRISEYCKESMRFGSCSSSTSKKFLTAAATEPALALSRSESLKDRQQWTVRTKPPLHAMEPPPDSSPTSVDYWSDPERHCAARPEPDTLWVRILECSELTTKNGQCDPFALVTILYSNGKKVERRTKSRKKTINPQFDERFCFDLLLEADQKEKDVWGSGVAAVAVEARVSVWHDAATPAFLGEVRLPLRQPTNAANKAWYFLSSRCAGEASRGATPPGTRLSASSWACALGSLRLLLQYTVDHVFPAHHYKRLNALFLKSVHVKPITASAVYILGEIVSSKTDAAQPLVRLLTHHDLIVPIVRQLADAEISGLTDATIIFRGNTLVSKMMDEAMRLSGAGYLRAVLRPTLAAVLQEKKPCEIDPARVKPSGAVHANLANLKDYVERVFGAITSSYAACPAPMCRLFDALRQCATRHFPRNAEVRYSVVSGFIFLRFFAPAILGPRLFDLTTEQIDPQTNRTLTLISKTIQSLGNLVSSRSAQQVCKEDYMAALYRSFCTPKHVQAIKQFLEIISTGADTQNNNVQETPVLLKEGMMLKRSESARGAGNGGSPRRRWTRAAYAHAKRRHFRLTSTELSWSRCAGRAPVRKLPLSGVLAVAPVDHPPAGAPLGANNIFQIVHRERTLYMQASNCVERAEWMRLLSALCKRTHNAPQHTGFYCDNMWTCCGACGAEAEGCGSASPSEAGSGSEAESEESRGAARLALRLDPARDLQRLHALLITHTRQLDDRAHHPSEGTCEEREAEAQTLRELSEAVFDLETRHRVYRRSLARETKYGSKQAPIGDDNYLHLAGAGGGLSPAIETGTFSCRAWATSPVYTPTIDLDGKPVRSLTHIDIGSSNESLKLARATDERTSGKSNKSTGSGYLKMSCLKNDFSEDSDGSGEKPARPPKNVIVATPEAPARHEKPICEYVDIEPKTPERRPRSVIKKVIDVGEDTPYRCKEYELMSNFMSATRVKDEDTPPAVPPRSHHLNSLSKRLSAKLEEPRPKMEEPPVKEIKEGVHSLERIKENKPFDMNECIKKKEKRSQFDYDLDSLDDLPKDAYCVLKVCEDEITDSKEEPRLENKKETIKSSESIPKETEKEECGLFSRMSLHRKSNPIKSQASTHKALKMSSSTSNVREVGSQPCKPITERFTPSFLKKKIKSPEEPAPPPPPKLPKKEENLIGKLTPRFGQSRLYSRGQSLDLNSKVNEKTKGIERSATAISIPTRPINSSIVANLKFLSLHRYGAQDEPVQCQKFVRNCDEALAPESAPEVGPEADSVMEPVASEKDKVEDSEMVLEYVFEGDVNFDKLVILREKRNEARRSLNAKETEFLDKNLSLASTSQPLLASSTSDLRL